MPVCASSGKNTSNRTKSYQKPTGQASMCDVDFVRESRRDAAAIWETAQEPKSTPRDLNITPCGRKMCQLVYGSSVKHLKSHQERSHASKIRFNALMSICSRIPKAGCDLGGCFGGARPPQEHPKRLQDRPMKAHNVQTCVCNVAHVKGYSDHPWKTWRIASVSKYSGILADRY